MFLVKKVRLIVALTMIPIIFFACKPRQTETVVESQPETVVEPEIPVIEPEGPIYIINPAEIYCIGLGYEYTTRERKIDKQELQTPTPVEPTPDTLEGPHPGIPVIPEYILEVVCVFPDGNGCEEWEFMMGRCGQEYSYCVQQGYSLKPGMNSVTCVFPDGSSCPEFEFFNGSCGPAPSQQTEVSANEFVKIECAEFYENQHPTADIEVVVGDEFQITLCSNPSTGFQWSELTDISNQDIVGQISHVFIGPPEGDQPPPPGTAGNEMWTFRANKEGNSTISFEYSQDWDGGEKATWTFVLNVLVK